MAEEEYGRVSFSLTANDLKATTAQNDATEAKNTANTVLQQIGTKTSVYYSQTQPTSANVNDIWFVTDANGVVTSIKNYDGQAWVDRKLTNTALNVTELSSIQANLGNVTAGNITGVNIRGSFFTATGKNSSGVAGKDTVYIGKSNDDPSILIQDNDKATDKAEIYSGVISCQNEEAYNMLYPYGFDANQKVGDAYDSVSLDTSTITMYKASLQKVYINNSGEIMVAGPVTSGNIQMNGGHTLQTVDGTGLTIQDNIGAKMVLTNDGNNRIYSMDIYNRTYSGAANVEVTSSGTLGRTTSATKYKENIQYDLTIDDAKKILDVRPATWHDKSADEALARSVETGDESGDVPYFQRYAGFIAEDIKAAGLDQFVTYGSPDTAGNREIEGIEYDRIPVLHNLILRDHEQEINLLKTRVGVLETILKQKGIME